MDKVSVIVPVLNRRKQLQRCLDSITAQTWRQIELIIVDNGSDDGSYEFALEWSSCVARAGFQTVVIREEIRGVSRARNRGLAVATGEFTVFFDSDDLMHPDLVEKGISEFKKRESLRIVCWRCAIRMLDGSMRLSPFYPEKALECHLLHSMLRTHGYMVQTDFLRESGGWNESLYCWNDWELGLRLLLKCFSQGEQGRQYGDEIVKGIPEVLADIYSQPQSITGTGFSGKAGEWEKAIAIVRSEIRSCSHPFKGELESLVVFKEVLLAAAYRREGRKDLARRLFEKVVEDNRIPGAVRCVLRVAFLYASIGGRGSWRVMTPLLRSSFSATH